MAIIRKTSPTSTPAALADWQNAIAQIELAHKNGNSLFPAVYSGGSWYVPRGYSFYHRGTVYIADADTLITGTFSRYIGMTKSGDSSTCTASFVAALTGITWDDAWVGYFDASDNLVIVDEFDDANAGTLEPRSALGWLGKKLLTLAIEIENLTVGDSLTVDNDATITGNLIGSGASDFTGFRKHVTGYTGATPPFLLGFPSNCAGISQAGIIVAACINVQNISFAAGSPMDFIVRIIRPSGDTTGKIDRCYVVAKDDDNIFGKAYNDAGWDHALYSDTTTYTVFPPTEASPYGVPFSPVLSYNAFDFKFTISSDIPDTKWLVFFISGDNDNQYLVDVSLALTTNERDSMSCIYKGVGATTLVAGSARVW